MAMTTEDYHRLLYQLLPTGLAWPRDASSVLSRLLRGLAGEFSRVDDHASSLLAELPDQTSGLIEDWEHLLGIDNDPSLSLEERRRILISMLSRSGEGGLSISRMTSLAESFLGYAPILREHNEIVRVGPQSYGVVGQARLFPAEVTFTWSLDIDPSQTDQNAYDPKRLEAAIEAAKPAHTTAYVGFAGPFYVGIGRIEHDKL